MAWERVPRSLRPEPRPSRSYSSSYNFVCPPIMPLSPVILGQEIIDDPDAMRRRRWASLPLSSPRGPPAGPPPASRSPVTVELSLLQPDPQHLQDTSTDLVFQRIVAEQRQMPRPAPRGDPPRDGVHQPEGRLPSQTLRRSYHRSLPQSSRHHGLTGLPFYSRGQMKVYQRW